MRVVVVSAWEPWRTSDAAAFVLDHQLRRLAGRHEVTLLAAGAPGVRSAPPPELAQRYPGVDVRWYGAGSAPVSDYLARRLRSWRGREPAHVGFVERPDLVASLRETVAAGADLVHLHGWGTAGLRRHVGDVPAVHVALDSWARNVRNRRRPLTRRLTDAGQQRLIRAHEARHYPRLGAVVVVAEPDAAAVRELAPDARVEVVPNGVEPGPAPVAVPDDSVLGFHGVFDSRANVDAARSLVADILPLVRRTVPEATALLVGRRPPREVRTLAGADVELRADVADARPELDRMAVYVAWMTSGSGLKNKVLEAMAAGRSVVTSPLGAAGIGEGDGVLVAETPVQAAGMAAQLLTQRVRAREVGEAGRRRVVEDFGWDRNAARIEALWAEVAGCASRS